MGLSDIGRIPDAQLEYRVGVLNALNELIEEQKETNRLLGEILKNTKSVDRTIPDGQIQPSDIEIPDKEGPILIFGTATEYHLFYVRMGPVIQYNKEDIWPSSEKNVGIYVGWQLEAKAEIAKHHNEKNSKQG